MTPSLLSLLLPIAAPVNNRVRGQEIGICNISRGEALLSLQLHFGCINGRNYGFHQQGGFLTPFHGTRALMDKS